MAMPANLTSFCLASTFDTLPSPTNLKRWRITTEAMCTLCSKDVCTTPHILGVCKVSVQQGRYTFTHDTVLRKIIESLISFILNIKQTGISWPCILGKEYYDMLKSIEFGDLKIFISKIKLTHGLENRQRIPTTWSIFRRIFYMKQLHVVFVCV